MKIFLFFLALLLIYLAFPGISFDFCNSIFGFICFVPTFFLIEILKKEKRNNSSYRNLFFIFLLSIFINFVLFNWIISTIMMFGINVLLALIFLTILSIYLSVFLDIFFYIFYVNNKNYVF